MSLVSRSLHSRLVACLCVALCAPRLPPVAQPAGDGDARGRQQYQATSFGVRMAAEAQAEAPLCRYGVDDVGSFEGLAVDDLRVGWYINFVHLPDSQAPTSLTYMPTIRLQPDASGYRLSNTTVEQIADQAAASPGLTWLIGNEPDSPYQDNLEPHVYAAAYHDLHAAIKTADPSALVGNGGIVQPTPVRLLYLDMVLAAYREAYGTQMPVDVWNTHIYILREKSCKDYPKDCWGADIPPGIDWAEGELYTIDDNANLTVFKSMVRDFRAWMASRGYRDRPMIITEFGVQMPADYGFPPERVNGYMADTFSFLETVTDTTGFPADGYRLAQRWAWWSLQRCPECLNGFLFDDGAPPIRTVFGDTYAAYTAPLTASANLYPVRIGTEPSLLYSPTDPVTLTLAARVANDGNTGAVSTTVRFYEGTPGSPGDQIGSDVAVPALTGCGGNLLATVEMTAVMPGAHPVFVVVDATEAVAETSETDNSLEGVVLVGLHRTMLPVTARSFALP